MRFKRILIKQKVLGVFGLEDFDVQQHVVVL